MPFAGIRTQKVVSTGIAESLLQPLGRQLISNTILGADFISQHCEKQHRSPHTHQQQKHQRPSSSEPEEAKLIAGLEGETAADRDSCHYSVRRINHIVQSLHYRHRVDLQDRPGQTTSTTSLSGRHIFLDSTQQHHLVQQTINNTMSSLLKKAGLIFDENKVSGERRLWSFVFWTSRAARCDGVVSSAWLRSGNIGTISQNGSSGRISLLLCALGRTQ